MKSLPTLDLHGRTVDEIADLVDRFITKETARGSERIRIMTGRGTGKVKEATQKYLKLGGFPFELERTISGGRNEGVLIVFLD
ncbi:MAG TPA: Smr/MutS family protein [Bdellovibrionales bacterium]|jgi:dsDNA-specific endonuclease/ATPase MutS2|nr:Smr/MutS family protein [Bdellovibrionales bacterium]